MDLHNDPYIKLLNLAVGIGTDWGMSPKQVSAMLGREMASDDDKVEWSIEVSDCPIADVEERALKIAQLKTALDEAWGEEAQRNKLDESQQGLGGKTLRDLLISGEREDLDNAVDFVHQLYGG